MPSRDRDTPSALGSSVPRNAGRRGGRGFITSNSMPSRRQPAMGVARLRACEPTTGITRCVTITASFGTRATETPRHRSPADERVTGVTNSSEGRRGVLPLRWSNSSVTFGNCPRKRTTTFLHEATAFKTHSLNRYLSPCLPASLVYFNTRSLVILLVEHFRLTFRCDASRHVTAAAVNR